MGVQEREWWIISLRTNISGKVKIGAYISMHGAVQYN